MTDCSHTFAWWGVVPPTHCPVCGACMYCHAPRPVPVMPRPWPSPYYPPYRPWPYVTYTTNVIPDNGTVCVSTT